MLEFTFEGGLTVLANHAIVGRTKVRLWAVRIWTTAGCQAVCIKDAWLKLTLAKLSQVNLPTLLGPQVVWRRDNPEQDVKGLRWIVRLHFEMKPPRSPRISAG